VTNKGIWFNLASKTASDMKSDIVGKQLMTGWVYIYVVYIPFVTV
jgi:hypothetical protein